MAKIINVFINGTDEEAHDLIEHRGITSLANLLNALVKKDTDTINLCLNGCSEPPSIYRTPCLMGIIPVTRSYDEQQQLYKRI